MQWLYCCHPKCDTLPVSSSTALCLGHSVVVFVKTHVLKRKVRLRCANGFDLSGSCFLSHGVSMSLMYDHSQKWPCCQLGNIRGTRSVEVREVVVSLIWSLMVDSLHVSLDETGSAAYQWRSSCQHVEEMCSTKRTGSGLCFCTSSPANLASGCLLTSASLKVVDRVCSARTHCRTIHRYARRAHRSLSFLLSMEQPWALVQSECFVLLLYVRSCWCGTLWKASFTAWFEHDSALSRVIMQCCAQKSILFTFRHLNA